MSKCLFRFLVGVVLVFLAGRVHPQWIEATGPKEGKIGRAFIDPVDSSNVYVVATRLYMSEDGGKTFRVHSEFSKQVRTPYFGLMTISRDKDGPIIMLNAMGGLIVSDDRGRTWRMTGAINEVRYSTGLQAGPAGSKVFYSYGHGFIARTSDNGKTWARYDKFPDDMGRVERFVSDRFDKDTVSFMYRSAGDTHFMMSRDGAKSFQEVDFPEGEDFIASVSTDPDDSELLYVCTQKNGWGRGGERRYFYSYDGGKTWELYFDPDSGKAMSKAIGDKIRQVFPAMSCSAVREFRGFVPNRDEVTWAEDGTGLKLVSIAGRLYRSEDFGRTWERAGEGIVAGSVSHLALDPTDPKSAICSDSLNVWHTSDRGKTWDSVPVENIWYVRGLRYLPDDKGILLTSNGIWKGSSDGKKWAKRWATNQMKRGPYGIFTGRGGDGEENRDVRSEISITVAATGFLLKSKDGGDEWDETGGLDLEFPRGQGEYECAQVTLDGKELWYSNSTKGLVVSEDEGKTWTKVDGFPEERKKWCVALDGSIWSLDFHGAYLFDGEERKIDLHSGNRLTRPRAITVDPKDAGTAYVGMTDGSVIRITGKGEAVERLEGGPRGVPILSMVISPRDGALWAGTEGNGVWILEDPKDHKVMEGEDGSE